MLQVGRFVVAGCSLAGALLVTRRPPYLFSTRLLRLRLVVRVLYVSLLAGFLLPFLQALAWTHLWHVGLILGTTLLMGSSPIPLYCYLYCLLSRLNQSVRFWCILTVSLTVVALAVNTAYLSYIYGFVIPGGGMMFLTPAFRLLAAFPVLTYAGSILISTVYYCLCRSRVGRLIAEHPANATASAA